jgi:hypothetical protein
MIPSRPMFAPLYVSSFCVLIGARHREKVLRVD